MLTFLVAVGSYVVGLGMGLIVRRASDGDLAARNEEARKRAWRSHLRFRARLRELRDLVSHMWVHDGYGTNGFRKMTLEQRHLYCRQIHQPHDIVHEWEYKAKP